MINAELKSGAKILRSWGVFLFVALVIADQFSKFWASHTYKNYDFAFSLRINVYLMYAVYLAGIGGIVAHLIKRWRAIEPREILAWIIILSGAASNVAERIVLGYVRDWIYILNGAFNLADGYIIVGMIILLLIGDTNSV